VSHADPHHYQPTNITFGIMPPPDPPDGGRLKRADRKTATSERALRALDEWIAPALTR
jgi:folate-dependent tRNA-U54 methylase TrmFO/GidA